MDQAYRALGELLAVCSELELIGGYEAVGEEVIIRREAGIFALKLFPAIWYLTGMLRGFAAARRVRPAGFLP